METLITVIISIGFLALGILIGFVFRQMALKRQGQAAASLAERIISEAKKEAENIKKESLIQAKENILKIKADLDKEYKERKQELESLERRLRSKEEHLDKRTDTLTQKESALEEREKNLLQKEKVLQEKLGKVERSLEEQRLALEKIAGMTAEEAKKELMSLMEAEAKAEAATIIRKIEDETKKAADKKAQEIIAYAIQRYAGEFVAENTVSVVNLPNDEMKGRIIGREGRNIRAIEMATGIDLIVDDTPEAVVLSSFDPIRREVARISLERLIADGRIHPGRIEEIVKKAKAEVDSIIREVGERTCFDLGLHDIHPELIYLLGSLKFRKSFSQNVLQHSIEVAHLTAMMAAEIKLNIKEAKRAGLLHDIGKAVDHEVEGSHATIGADIARRYGESPSIVQAIAAHHDDGRTNTMLGVLVQAADTLSAARPGARREMIESYVKRLEELENLARSFKGVEKCYAIQAGREIRILVENEKISDNDAVMLCRDIVKKIEQELTYPGQIKVTVIRETRVSDYAR
ncbi:MAG TPA: ribonuclease Y [Syntrophales bacterium]|nr:ribonuclease Y [Syntrophales bacterium]HOL59540.1 ribonuclease Y [Syntrophales bacterium]HPO35630.1 ribonuclease Y [Syntrophales bacterium]